MGAWAQLLLGIAAIITSLGSATAGVIIAVRGAKRDRRDVARTVIDRIAADEYDAQEDAEREAIETLRKRVAELEQRKAEEREGPS